MALPTSCTNSDMRYILEFIGCDLVVVQNSETIFKAKELSLCPWFDEICDYCYCKHSISANGSIEVAGPLDANFLYVKIEWPSNAKESERLASIQLPKFHKTTLLPNGAEFEDHGLGTQEYPISDFIMLNSAVQYEQYKINNYTEYDIKVHVITATHCDSKASEPNQPSSGSSVPDYIG